MKRVLIVLVVLIGGFAGYLVYDWMAVANKRANAPVVNIYSWKDAGGTVHFSDKPPPPGVEEIHQTRGQAYVAPPLVIRMKQTASEWFGKAKESIPKRSDKRPRRSRK